MKNQLIILLSLFVSMVYSQGKPLDSYVPTGWKLLAKATGDLNKDGLDDAAIVIENTDPANIIKNEEGLGAKELNTNPRHLLILFQESGGYVLKFINKKFIPSEHIAEAPCVTDPFSAGEDFRIKKQVLHLRFGNWSSCGSWYAGSSTYKFRFQEDNFILIGYDEFSMHRAAGNIFSESINFLTKKKIVTTGGNEFDQKLNHPVSKTTTIRLPVSIKLQDMQGITGKEFNF
ncbi:MAG: hypothetical protein ACOVRN_12800 [Flavobacterium sp.]